MTRPALAAVLLLPVLAGCDAPYPAVRLVVTAEPAVLAAIDSIKVTIIGAADDSENQLCIPKPVTFGPPLAMPVEVLVERGSTFQGWVGFRVEGKLGDDPVPVVLREESKPWPEEGVLDVTVQLEESCLRSGCLAGLEQCIHDYCASVPHRRVFDDPGLWRTGLSCFPEEP